MNHQNDKKIPTTVITGFLGCGKTTLIQNILEKNQDKKIAVIINEFGEVGMDGEILKNAQPNCKNNLIELANGCICCTVAEDFIPAMNTILNQKQKPEHIIIETSGLALPQPLINAFNWHEIKHQTMLDGVITLIDADARNKGQVAQNPAKVKEQKKQIQDHETPVNQLLNDQIASADIIILNKTDLLEENEINAVEADIKEKMPHDTPIIKTKHAQLKTEIILGINAESEKNPKNSNRHHNHHDHHHEDDHEHDDFTSYVITMKPAQNKEHIIQKLNDAIETQQILRAKGYIALENHDARLAIQAVGTRITSWFDKIWDDKEEKISKIVVIGYHDMNKDHIETILNS